MTKSKVHIAALYALFAGIATGANLIAQVLVTQNYDGQFDIMISIIVGTLVGLPVKYVLDKKFIFAFTADNIAHDSKLFVLYSLMAVVTTLIFWGTELAFQWIFGTELLRLTGGAIGLVIGYFIKYQLDKKYVFTRKTSE